MVKKYGELLHEAKLRLRAAGWPDAEQAARELLSSASGKSPASLLADRELYASEAAGKKLGELTARMEQGEPLAYVLGQWDFYGLTLKVTPDVLVPRDDSVAVADLAVEALRRMEPGRRVLDLGTGSGCLGLAVAHSVDSAHVTLADVSPEALKIARQNAALLHLQARALPMQLDMLLPPPAYLGKFGLIISNPPYVTGAEMQTLEPSVRNYEPRLALDGGAGGLKFYRAIAKNFTACLEKGGYLCLEFGLGQQTAVGEILRAAGYQELLFARDARGVVRCVRGKIY
jgi:release factor glutamine methyltransferase